MCPFALAAILAVTVALATGMRYSEIRLLRWKQIDLEKHTLTVGDSKTEAGAGRPIPLNDRARMVLDMWAAHFPNREAEHYLFPTEKCGVAGDDSKPYVYGYGPDRANRRLEGGLGSCEGTGEGRLRLSRLPARGLHSDARRRSAVLGCGGNHGLEPINCREDGEALWAHRASGATRGGKAPQRGRFCGRWGTKLGTVSSRPFCCFD